MPIPRTKQILLKHFRYNYHPLTRSLIELDEFQLRPRNVLSCLSDEQVTILLRSITLQVSLDLNSKDYWLLAPDPIFDELKLHPNASNQTISLCIHNDPEVAAVTLLFVRPALHYRYEQKPLTVLSRRIQVAKSLNTVHQNLASLIPRKSWLAKLANVSRSLLRHKNG
jgi:hypothetical protein